MNIESIDGIGSKTGAARRKAGIFTVQKLLEAGCTKAGRRNLAAAPRHNKNQLLKCVNMAGLFRIQGVASQYAELLEAARIQS